MEVYATPLEVCNNYHRRAARALRGEGGAAVRCGERANICLPVSAAEGGLRARSSSGEREGRVVCVVVVCGWGAGVVGRGGGDVGGEARVVATG